jgi:signal transduction histidine kinase
MVQRRQWHWVDWSLFAILTGSSAMNVLFVITHPEKFTNISISLIVTGLVLGYLIPLFFWRPNYVNPALFPIAVLITIGTLELYVTYKMQEPVTILYCPLLIIGFLSDRKYVWWTAPVFITGFPVASLIIVHQDPGLSNFFSDFIYEVLFFGMGLATQRFLKTNENAAKLLQENQYQYQLIQGQNSVLEQYANQIEQLTLKEERNRMASELHDTVGHTFTSVIMGMDAVAYLIENAPQKAIERLDVLRTVTRNGLEEVRRSIHQMAPDDDDHLLSLQLSRLGNEFALHTGTQLHIHTSGSEYELPKQTKLTMIRCLQEALTNAKRHGRAASIEVFLTFYPNQVELKIEDDGIGTEDLKAGFGISAMQDRISALQGSLQLTSSPSQGTSVHCIIPTRTI